MSQLRKKSVAKKAPKPKKTKGASTYEPPLYFNKKKFHDKEKEERFFILLNWVFVPERRVELKQDEYLEFQEPLQRIRWWNLATPHDKFDPEVVGEFYANAYRSEEGDEPCDHKSWVRGRVITYDMVQSTFRIRKGRSL